MSTCTLAQKLSAADTWLQANIGPLIADANFQKSGLLIIAFDEAETQTRQTAVATFRSCW